MPDESLIKAAETAARENGAAASGAVCRAALEPAMTDAQRTRLETLVPGWRGVIAAAFPYYTDTPAPRRAISRYARGLDYHQVLRTRLAPAAETLRAAGFHAEVLVDASPVPERAAALLSGIGILGENGLVIVPPYGSYVFIGTVVTDAPVFGALPAAGEFPRCSGCGACRAACPSGALSADGFRIEICFSHLSQKKGELTAREQALLRENDCLWGCDACQEACPYNKAPHGTDIPEFSEALITTITREMLEGLSNQTFKERYGMRAFSWRGAGVLRRNLDILDGINQAKPKA